MLKKRLTGVNEIIDDFELKGEELIQNLQEIEQYNQFLGGHSALLSAIDKALKDIKKKEFSLLDLGCGGGDSLKKIAQYAQKKNYKATLTGIDANPFIVNYAKKNTYSFKEIEIKSHNIFDSSSLDSDKKFDFISANLLLHHFKEDEIIELLKKFIKKTSIAIVITDLHRHPLAYKGFSIITHLLNASHITKNDGKISISRGFKKNEWISILEKTGIKRYKISWKWAFRHQIIVNCQ